MIQFESRAQVLSRFVSHKAGCVVFRPQNDCGPTSKPFSPFCRVSRPFHQLSMRSCWVCSPACNEKPYHTVRVKRLAKLRSNSGTLHHERF